jgi:hypothetical protein
MVCAVTTPMTATDHFNTGVNGAASVQLPSLAADSARQNSAVPAGYKPTSVLGQFQLSAQNGRSQEAAERVLPATSPGFVGVRQLPSNDGISQPTNDSQRNLRMAGNLPISTNESSVS